MKNKLFPNLFLFTLSVLLIGCSILEPDRRLGPGPVPTQAAETVFQRPTYTVQRGTVSQVVKVTGSVAPVVQVEIFAPNTLPVDAVFVQRGDQVQKGQVIATLDTRELQEKRALEQAALLVAQEALQRAKDQAAANRRRYEIAVELAQLDLDFARQQAGNSPTPAELYNINRLALELELAQLDLEQYTASVDPALENTVAEIALGMDILDKQIQAAQITAPISGSLLSLNLTPGRLVNTGERIGLVADESQLEIRANLALETAALIQTGIPALLLPGQRPGIQFSGIVIEVPTPLNPEARLRIEPDEKARAALQIGEPVDIFLQIDERQDVLWLPAQAIREFNGRSFVVVLEALENGETRQRRVDVSLGLKGNDQVEILSGLDEGQLVIAP